MKDFDMGPGNIVYLEDPKTPVVYTHCTSCGAPYTDHSGNCEYCGTLSPFFIPVIPATGTDFRERVKYINSNPPRGSRAEDIAMGIDPLKESEAMRIARALHGVASLGVTLKQEGTR